MTSHSPLTTPAAPAARVANLRSLLPGVGPDLAWERAIPAAVWLAMPAVLTAIGVPPPVQAHVAHQSTAATPPRAYRQVPLLADAAEQAAVEAAAVTATTLLRYVGSPLNALPVSSALGYGLTAGNLSLGDCSAGGPPLPAPTLRLAAAYHYHPLGWVAHLAGITPGEVSADPAAGDGETLAALVGLRGARDWPILAHLLPCAGQPGGPHPRPPNASRHQQGGSAPGPLA